LESSAPHKQTGTMSPVLCPQKLRKKNLVRKDSCHKWQDTSLTRPPTPKMVFISYPLKLKFHFLF